MNTRQQHESVRLEVLEKIDELTKITPPEGQAYIMAMFEPLSRPDAYKQFDSPVAYNEALCRALTKLSNLVLSSIDGTQH